MKIVIAIYAAVIGTVFSPFLYRVLRHIFLRGKAARLHASLVNAVPDRIGSILPGMGSFLWLSDITIDRSCRAWVETKTQLTRSPPDRDVYLKREAKGWVLIVQDTVKFRRDQKVYWLIANYDPVVEIITATGQEWKTNL